MEFLANFPAASKIKKFENLCITYYNDFEIEDIYYITLEDFLAYIPHNDYKSNGDARLLWKRYIRPFINKK